MCHIRREPAIDALWPKLIERNIRLLLFVTNHTFTLNCFGYLRSQILLSANLHQQEGYSIPLLSTPATDCRDSFSDRWWSGLIKVNVWDIHHCCMYPISPRKCANQACHVLKKLHQTQKVSHCFCLCIENLTVQTSKSKTNNTICLCPLCKQIMKSPQSAQLIIMIITLSLLVSRQNLE